MAALLLLSLFVSGALTSSSIVTQSPRTLSTCRNLPGDPGYPTNEQWAVLNTTVSGRLVKIVPFVEFCNSQGGCTAEQSASSSFRAGVPGAMDGVRSLPFRFLASIEADTWFAAKLGAGWTHPRLWIDTIYSLYYRTSFRTHHLFVNRNVQPPVVKEMSHFLVSSLNRSATYR